MTLKRTRKNHYFWKCLCTYASKGAQNTEKRQNSHNMIFFWWIHSSTANHFVCKIPRLTAHTAHTHSEAAYRRRQYTRIKVRIPSHRRVRAHNCKDYETAVHRVHIFKGYEHALMWRKQTLAVAMWFLVAVVVGGGGSGGGGDGVVFLAVVLIAAVSKGIHDSTISYDDATAFVLVAGVWVRSSELLCLSTLLRHCTLIAVVVSILLFLFHFSFFSFSLPFYVPLFLLSLRRATHGAQFLRWLLQWNVSTNEYMCVCCHVWRGTFYDISVCLQNYMTLTYRKHSKIRSRSLYRSVGRFAYVVSHHRIRCIKMAKPHTEYRLLPFRPIDNCKYIIDWCFSPFSRSLAYILLRWLFCQRNTYPRKKRM